MIGVIRAELTKLARRPGIRVITAVWPLLGLIFGYLIPFLLRNMDEIQTAGVDLEDTLLPGAFVANAISGFPQFGVGLVVILGALAVGSEYGWGTVGSTLIQGPTRTSVHLGRLAALLLVALLYTVLALGVAALASMAAATALAEPMAFPPITLVLQGLLGGWLIMGMAAVLGATLALLLRSTALAVGLGLVYVFVIESLFSQFATAAGWVEAIARYLPGVNAGGVSAALQTAGDAGPGTNSVVSATHAVVVLLVYSVVLTVGGLVVFRRRDVAG